jgi:hypothetical protein
MCLVWFLNNNGQKWVVEWRVGTNVQVWRAWMGFWVTILKVAPRVGPPHFGCSCVIRDSATSFWERLVNCYANKHAERVLDIFYAEVWVVIKFGHYSICIIIGIIWARDQNRNWALSTWQTISDLRRRVALIVSCFVTNTPTMNDRVCLRRTTVQRW